MAQLEWATQLLTLTVLRDYCSQILGLRFHAIAAADFDDDRIRYHQRPSSPIVRPWSTVLPVMSSAGAANGTVLVSIGDVR